MAEFFADAESSFKDSKFVYYGYPYDGTACFRKGTSLAPDEIRKHSYNFETYLLELGVDITDVSMNDWGNIDVPSNQEKNEMAVEELEAHLDFRKEYENNPLSHATVTRRVSEIVGIDKVRPVGIRSVSQSEISEARSVGLNFLESGWTELREYLSDVIEDLEGPIYLSLDMDAIDPAFAPGVGTPEPLGMTPYEIIQTINFFSDRIVGFDCVEVCPPHDNGNTSALAARLIRHLVGAVWQSQERFK